MSSSSWLEASRWQDLDRIREAPFNALVLRRDSPLGSAADRIPQDWKAPGAGRIQDEGLSAGALAARLCEHLAEGALRAALQADVARCVAFFRRHAADDFQLRLGPVERVQCPKLHADHVALRLLCSYVGPGTEWLEDAHVRREALGNAIADIAEANQQIQCCPEGLQRARTGDLLLLKGERWPGQKGRGVVHRSPMIAPGQWRMVLTLTTLQVRSALP